MEHIGIDLGAKHSHVVVLSESGKLAQRQRVSTTLLPVWLQKRGPSRVVMEACTQSPAIATLGREAGHEVIIVPGHLVRALGVGRRSIKTDDRDAEVLALAAYRNPDLESVHVRSALSRSRRELLASRATLVKMRKTVSASIKSWLRGRLQSVKGRASSQFFADEVRRVAQEHEDGLPMPVEMKLETYEHLCKQIEKLDEELAKVVKEDKVIENLMTVPGVGPVVALSFVTHLDTPARFANAHRLSSYLALVPGENTTGGKVKRTSTIKAGPTHLKALLVQAAWSMWRSRPHDPAVVWAKRIADKRGSRIAIVALARKLATILWSMWKHGRRYDPARASTARAGEQAATTHSEATISEVALTGVRATTDSSRRAPSAPATHVATT